MATSVGKVLRAEPAVGFSYGWLCVTEWRYFKDQVEQPDSEEAHRKFHSGMQHYLFA